jgi:hypothetical protein
MSRDPSIRGQSDRLDLENGQPGAKPARMAGEPRKPGRLKGRVRVGPDFDEPLPAEILAPLRGEKATPQEED